MASCLVVSILYINELLNTLELSNIGACVMSTNVGNPSFADDFALVAIVPSKLQKLVDIVYRYCRTWHIDVNVTKSATVVYTNKKANHIQTGIMYGNAFIEQDDHAIHLGIRQDSNLSSNIHLLLFLNHVVIVVKLCCVEVLMEDRCTSKKHSR